MFHIGIKEFPIPKLPIVFPSISARESNETNRRRIGAKVCASFTLDDAVDTINNMLADAAIPVMIKANNNPYSVSVYVTSGNSNDLVNTGIESLMPIQADKLLIILTHKMANVLPKAI